MSFLPRLKKSIKTRLLVEAVFFFFDAKYPAAGGQNVEASCGGRVFFMPNTRGRMNNVFNREMGKPNAYPQKEKGNSKAVSQEGNG